MIIFSFLKSVIIVYICKLLKSYNISYKNILMITNLLDFILYKGHIKYKCLIFGHGMK